MAFDVLGVNVLRVVDVVTVDIGLTSRPSFALELQHHRNEQRRLNDCHLNSLDLRTIEAGEKSLVKTTRKRHMFKGKLNT